MPSPFWVKFVLHCSAAPHRKMTFWRHPSTPEFCPLGAHLRVIESKEKLKNIYYPPPRIRPDKFKNRRFSKGDDCPDPPPGPPGGGEPRTKLKIALSAARRDGVRKPLSSPKAHLTLCHFCTQCHLQLELSIKSP